MAAFGTSGLRGLVRELTDVVVVGHVSAFLRHLQSLGEFAPGMEVLLAGDLRPSTTEILEAAWQGVLDVGGAPRYLGRIPSPALAYAGFRARVPSLMVTGSHIPFDRNGIKFNRPQAELSKADEAGILAALPPFDGQRFSAAGQLHQRPQLPSADPSGLEQYRRRYLDFFVGTPLQGWRVGVYQHSGVARDLLPELLRALGADVVVLGRSEAFVPMDTEALRPEDRALAKDWVAQHRLDALLSTDGDADRPMLADAEGMWWRGDQLGQVCAALLAADAVVTPISSNTGLERSGRFARTRRTRIGSPYVIAGMEELLAEGAERVVGYEANGGFLLASRLQEEGRELHPLPTRDAILPMLAALIAAARRKKPLASLLQELPQRFTVSDRVQDFPAEKSRALLARYCDAETGLAAFNQDFVDLRFTAEDRDLTDGVRMRSAADEILHLRPSGNAPELRCYVEAASAERAEQLLQAAMQQLHAWRGI
ncbi:phosphomannomutase [Candidatus Igneacidithiobacillus taiwanensis]|uniref:phosphomannomutase n=1 Tax=Candidatus Igneacidithiobacillus taiwanensis TaxID=1945924 RepID=UPI00289B2A46|nr:phosphomannomutase [Candidatus Igneacidithiobacillus taiwanensis]